MRLYVAALCAMALGACATAPQVPSMRPLTQQHIETMGPTPAVVVENNNGIEKSWFYTSTSGAGAAYGLVGALVSAAMDAIINAGPSRRATKAATEMAELVSVESLNASLTEHLRQQAPAEAATATGVSYSEVQSLQPIGAPDVIDDRVAISVRYTLSEDSSTLRVIATASYQSEQTPYATPYDFGGNVPRAQREGPAYANTFTYYSRQLPVPTLTPELQERLIRSIEDSARDENGALPAEGTNEHRSMTRELENARDNNLTKDEVAIFLTREWLRDNGAMLRAEIEQAHAFIARYVLLDMNRPVVPTMGGVDELLETMADERTVRRIGSGTAAGSYVSSAANVTSFSTYGNTIAVSRANRERMDALRDAARAQSRN
jgi:hypothetical protein